MSRLRRSTGSDRSVAADRQAAKRARELLVSLLDEEQRQDLTTYRGFRVRTAERLYWIPLRGKPASVRYADGLIENYCVDVDQSHGMPLADVALTHLIWIQGDASNFHAQANVLSRSRVPATGAASDLVRFLHPFGARPDTPPRPRRRRQAAPPYTPVVLTAEQRAEIGALLRRTRIRLKAAQLHRRFGASYPDELIGKLARRLVATSS